MLVIVQAPIISQPGCFFFVVAPFCSCPASLVSRKLFAVGPGCAKCFFFFVALRWAPRPFGGARAKFFLLLWPRAGAQRGFSFPCLSPGPEQTKKTPWVVFFFFCSGPVPAPNGASPSLAFRRGRSKKKKHPGWCFFFLLWPRAGAQRGFSFPCLSPGPQQKKKHPGWCFFFCCGPARTLTHSLRAWVAMPPPRRGGVFFFFAAAPPGPGWCFFFFCCGPARTLTHSRWAGAISARPGCFFFFLLRPRRVFLDNNKKCLGYYIGSKKTRRGHSKKKKHRFHNITP